MKSIIFRFERWGDIEDLMQNRDLLDMINSGNIKVRTDKTKNEFKVYFNKPFDFYPIDAVLDLVSVYVQYN